MKPGAKLERECSMLKDSKDNEVLANNNFIIGQHGINILYILSFLTISSSM